MSNYKSPENVDGYLKVYSGLAHPMRIKIIGVLWEGRRHVSELAKMLEISRPLLYMHLKKLEEAEMVSSSYEISESGKSMRYYKVNDFIILITPPMLADLAKAIPLPLKAKENSTNNSTDG
ncbi:MAG: winged helix-turn-helix domain-containing protein [Defluviitaleaceae bacterium]|nr:winged helix-turn-helix domain-containing protein [Defluviitaleaceae bacterium]